MMVRKKNETPRIKPKILGLGPVGLTLIVFWIHGTGPLELCINMSFFRFSFVKLESSAQNNAIFTFSYALKLSFWFTSVYQKVGVTTKVHHALGSQTRGVVCARAASRSTLRPIMLIIIYPLGPSI